MQHTLKFSMLAAAACLLGTATNAQNPVNGLTPADTRPSLIAPPSQSTFDSSANDFRPLESFPPAYQGSTGHSTVVNSQPLTNCPPAMLGTTTARPIVPLQPIHLPPASYSQTYVPPPPSRARYATPVVYQRPVVYSETIPATVVYQRPIAPVAVATPQYYLPPVLPIQNVPVGATIGRGVLGQPTVYVPGQPVRNVLRYLSP